MKAYYIFINSHSKFKVCEKTLKKAINSCAKNIEEMLGSREHMSLEIHIETRSVTNEEFRIDKKGLL